MAGRKLTNEQFIEKCIEIHGNKYDYSKTFFVRSRDPVSIICPKHGEFTQRASVHLEGKGCRLCKNEKIGKNLKHTKEQFIENLSEWSKENLDFSNFNYVTNKIKGKVRCKVHDIEFETRPSNLIKNKRSCPECVKESFKESKRNSKQDFIKLSIEKHGDKFDYSLLPDSFHSHDHIEIKCNECNRSFWRMAYSHCNIGHACPKCQSSSIQKMIEEFLIENHIEFISNDRNILDGKEIDVVVPSKNLGIECNGNYWHGEKLTGKFDYHLEKTEKALNKNYNLLHFFEDELIYKFEIIKSILTQKLNISTNKIYARKCEIRNVEVKDKNNFLDHNHIQGKDYSKIKLGLYYNTELVSLMTFGHPRYNKNYEWELIRFCSKKNFNVVGGASKLLKHFERTYNPASIISYADKRISTGHLYDMLGFDYSHDSDPRYYYFPNKNPLERIHRSNFTKSKIKKKYPNVDLNKTEKEIMEEFGYGRIWDCGTKVYTKRL